MNELSILLFRRLLAVAFCLAGVYPLDATLRRVFLKKKKKTYCARKLPN